MKKAEILIDLSQFVCEPAWSGIQRVLVELVRGWPPGIVPADIGYGESGDYAIVPLERARSVLQSHFDGDAESVKTARSSGAVKTRLDQMVTAKIPARELFSHFSAYLLPEPTFRDEGLDMLHQWSSRQPQSTFAIFFDALPQTHPQTFPSPHQMGTSRYYREVASVENVACISAASLDCLVRRLRRRPVSNAMIFPLGANPIAPGPARPAPSPATFVSIGTVEPRKNHPIILDAFNEFWRAGSDYRLHFIGARGWYTDTFFKKISTKLAEDPDRFKWSEAAGDAEIHDALLQSTAAIYLSEAEGFGLPAIEALAAGCPLIATASLPALERLPTLGQVRLNEVTVESVRAAVQRVADPEVNHRLRAEVARLRLPTWQNFAHQLVGWIRGTLDGTPLSTAGLQSEPHVLAQ